MWNTVCCWLSSRWWSSLRYSSLGQPSLTYSKVSATPSRAHRPTRGQALAEFALVLPFLLLIIVGGLHLGLMVVDRMRVIHAAQQTAIRAAATDCSTAEVVAERIFGGTLNLVQCTEQGQEVTVRIVHSFPALVPWLPDSVIATERAIKQGGS